jgi:hypothetical protein
MLLDVVAGRTDDACVGLELQIEPGRHVGGGAFVRERLAPGEDVVDSVAVTYTSWMGSGNTGYIVVTPRRLIYLQSKWWIALWPTKPFSLRLDQIDSCFSAQIEPSTFPRSWKTENQRLLIITTTDNKRMDFWPGRDPDEIAATVMRLKREYLDAAGATDASTS